MGGEAGLRREINLTQDFAAKSLIGPSGRRGLRRDDADRRSRSQEVAANRSTRSVYRKGNKSQRRTPDASVDMPARNNGLMLNEKRRAPRTRCLREGHCVFNNGCSDLNVLVRNISSTGAKLCGDELHCLPEEFELRIYDGFGAFTSRRVKRVWTRAVIRRRIHRRRWRAACGSSRAGAANAFPRGSRDPAE